MKAVVMELENGYAAILQEDGTIVRHKSNNLMIGDVVTMNKTTVHKKRRIGIVAVATAVFLALFGSAAYAYTTPAYYVSLDVNPGIVMEVNLLERVIGIEARNDEAKGVLANLDLKNLNAQAAIALAIKRMNELGYFTDEEGNIVLATTAKNEKRAEQFLERLQNAVEAENRTNGLNARVTAEVFGYEMVEAAKAIEGMTPGRYNILVNLLGIDEDDAKNYVDTPIRDLMKEFNASQGENGDRIQNQLQDRNHEQAQDQTRDQDRDKIKENAQLNEGNGGPQGENNGFMEQNAVRETEQAEQQYGNPPTNGQMPDNKGPNGGPMQNNPTNNRP